MNSYKDVSKKMQEEEIRITIRVNEQRSHEFDLFEIPKREVIYHLKSKYFRQELESHLEVKFIYLGKILGDTQLIQDIKFKNGQVIQAYIIDMQNEQQLQQEQQQQQQQQQQEGNNQIQINVNLEEIQNQYEMGSLWEFAAGVVLGYVFYILALLFQCLVNCSVRTKQGIILGFIIRLIHLQIALM